MPDPEVLRAVIVDDERLARVQLRELLAEHPRVCVAGEAASVEAAVAVIAEVRPHVVFLDVQMPGASGFDLLARVTASFRVVFVTAFDDYAVRAFEVNALDYLLKPVQPERLEAAVARLFAPVPAMPAEGPALADEDLLFLEFKGQPRFVRLAAVRSITAEGPYSRVTLADGPSTLVLRPLCDWERRLPAETFLRIHRSAIINTGQVAEVRNLAGYRCEVRLRGAADPLVMSRRHARRLRQRMP